MRRPWRALEIREGVDPAAAIPHATAPDLEMEVRTRGVARLTDTPHLLSLGYALAAANRDRRHVVVGRVQTGPVGDPDLVPATIALPSGKDDGPACCGADRRAIVRGDVEPVMAVMEILADVVAAARHGPVEGA